MAKLNWHKLQTQSREQTRLERPYYTNPKAGFDKGWHQKHAQKKQQKDRLIRDRALAMIRANKKA